MTEEKVAFEKHRRQFLTRLANCPIDLGVLEDGSYQSTYNDAARAAWVAALAYAKTLPVPEKCFCGLCP
jgi:hypothetical protein